MRTTVLLLTLAAIAAAMAAVVLAL